MTPLSTLITEYGHSLDRMEGEKAMQKEIVAKAEQLSITPATFRKLAQAFHQDKVSDLRDSAQEQLALLDGLQS
jgi:hypothetical protein